MVESYGAQSILVTGDSQADVRQKVAMDEVRRSLADAADKGDFSKLRKATQGFEAIFINKMWEEMRKSVPKDGYLHSREEDTYRGMFERQMAQKMAEGGGMGLGQMLFDQLREQLISAAGGTRTRTVLPNLDADQGKGIPLDAAKPEIKSLEDAHRAKSLEEAGIVLRRAAERSLGPAEKAEAMPTDMEPDFNPLADTDPGEVAAASAPPEIMNRALNLATQIEMQRSRTVAEAVAKDSSARGPEPGDLHWPIGQGSVASNYGWRKDPDTGERSWKPGVDIYAAPGTPVEAGWDGTVAFAGKRDGMGTTVVVEHGEGWRTIYANAGAARVKAGDKVKAGSILATMQGNGTEVPPKMYFEIRKGEQAWNPESIRKPAQNIASAR